MKRLLIAILVLMAGISLAAGTNDVIKLDDITKVDSYKQGKITIGGKLIRSDIIVLPDGTVQHPWSTKTRHVLTAEDIPELMDLKLDVLIIGAGHLGLMKPTNDLMKELETKGIEVLILKTDSAIKKLEELRKGGKQVAACFHIGC